ncbi:MAG: protein BatD, partial [Dyella sp.]
PATATAATASSVPWRWIALASIALWLLSLLGWLLYGRRRRQASPAPKLAEGVRTPVRTPGQAQQAFLQAADGEDSAAQARLLLDWARLERPALALQNLGELAAALADEDQRAAIAALQRARYAGAAPVKGLQSVFAQGLRWQRAGTGEDDSPLPSLYPFKLR